MTQRPRLRPAPARQSGVTLVELMVGIVAGLLVSAAALSFVATSLSTNSETISATRLSQELRSVLDVVARDLRRARFISDPIANIGRGQDNIVSLYDDVAIADGCVRFSYEDAGDEFRAYHLRDNGGRGEILFNSGAADPGCAGGVAISSPQVNITSFEVVDPDANVEPVCVRRVELVVTGSLAGAGGRTADITRTFRTLVALRSGALERCSS